MTRYGCGESIVEGESCYYKVWLWKKILEGLVGRGGIVDRGYCCERVLLGEGIAERERESIVTESIVEKGYC